MSSEPKERYDHNANNTTGTYPIDWDNDLVPIALWREQQAEIERLKAERDEAREAARVIYRGNLIKCDGSPYVPVKNRWPWLEQGGDDE